MYGIQQPVRNNNVDPLFRLCLWFGYGRVLGQTKRPLYWYGIQQGFFSSFALPQYTGCR